MSFDNNNTGCSRKKPHKIWHIINFEPCATESRYLQQNVHQRLLSTNQHRIYTNLLNLLCRYPACHHRHVNMAPITGEDQLLMKTLQTEKGSTDDRIIVRFPARQCITQFATLFCT